MPRLKVKALKTSSVNNISGVNADAYGLGQGEEADSETKLVELVAETMVTLGLSTHTDRLLRLMVENGVTNTAVLERLNAERCMELNLPYALVEATQKRWIAEKMNMGQDQGGSIEKEDPFKKLLEANKERMTGKNLLNALPGMSSPRASIGGMGGLNVDFGSMEDQMLATMNRALMPLQDLVLSRLQAMEDNLQRQLETTQEAISQRMDFSQVALLQTVNACQVLLHKLDSSQDTVMQKMDTQKNTVDQMVSSYAGLVKNIDGASDSTKQALLDTVNTSSSALLQKLDATQQDLLKQTNDSHNVLQTVAQAQTSLAKKVDSGNEFTQRRLVEVEGALGRKVDSATDVLTKAQDQTLEKMLASMRTDLDKLTTQGDDVLETTERSAKAQEERMGDVRRQNMMILDLLTSAERSMQSSAESLQNFTRGEIMRDSAANLEIKVREVIMQQMGKMQEAFLGGGEEGDENSFKAAVTQKHRLERHIFGFRLGADRISASANSSAEFRRAEWLQRHGAGIPQGEERQALAASLTKELEMQGFPRASVEEEVSQFMEKGRVSATNLDRLQRRLQRSLRQSEPTAEVTSQPVSARLTPRLEPLPTKSQPQASRPSVCYWDGDTLTVKPEYQKLARWSKIAAVQKLCMEDEQLKQQVADKERKSRYRDFLKEQIQEHIRAKEKEQEEKAKARVRADKDQEFLKIEASVAAQRRQEQMIRLKDDIMSQVATSRSKKQEEMTSDVSRAREENEKALRSLEEEKQLVLKKKEARRQIDQRQADLWATERHLQQEQKQADLKRRTEEKRRKEEETESARREKADLKERAAAEQAVFFEKLHQQQIKEGARTERLTKRNERLVIEQQALEPIRAAAQRAEAEDRQKEEERWKMRRENVEFLHKQMQEKEQRRKKDVEFEQAKLRESEDLARKEATIETKKQEDLQKRRSQYRQELVDQMVVRQAAKEEYLGHWFQHEATATGSATCTDNTAHTIPAATPDTMPPWEAQLIQEWVDAQTDDPIQYMEIPPDFPIPPNTQGDMQPLTHGRWRIEVVPSPDAPAHAPPARGRLPRIVRQGAEGTANTAPPFTTGLVGIFSQMTTEHWLLDIQQAPPPEQHEPGTMLLTAGDKLLFERVDGEWIIRGKEWDATGGYVGHVMYRCLDGNVSQACEESDTAIPEETEADIQHEGDDGKLEGPRPEDQEEDPAPFDADEPKCACRLVASTPAAGSAGSPSGDVTAEGLRSELPVAALAAAVTAAVLLLVFTVGLLRHRLLKRRAMAAAVAAAVGDMPTGPPLTPVAPPASACALGLPKVGSFSGRSARSTASAPTAASSHTRARTEECIDLVIDQLTLPPYWATRDGIHIFPDPNRIAEVQQLMNDTWRSRYTRDRWLVAGAERVPLGCRVANVLRVENHRAFTRYANYKDGLRMKRSGPCSLFRVQTSDRINLLDDEINERYLFHGTNPESAQSIARDLFKMDRAGSCAGSMFGRGIYLAENASKSDEYAKEGAGVYLGLCAMLLCRCAMGEVLTVSQPGDVQETVRAGGYDSVCGDRLAAAGTFREMVFFNEEELAASDIVVTDGEACCVRRVHCHLHARLRVKDLSWCEIWLHAEGRSLKECNSEWSNSKGVYSIPWYT
eukprot:s682_g4.t1